MDGIKAAIKIASNAESIILPLARASSTRRNPHPPYHATSTQLLLLTDISLCQSKGKELMRYTFFRPGAVAVLTDMTGALPLPDGDRGLQW